MSWKEIMKYAKIISYIARKYAGDPDLAEDVSQEVMVKLFEDKRLNTKKFDPAKKDAAIRQTIRNKVSIKNIHLMKKKLPGEVKLMGVNICRFCEGSL